MSNQEIKDAIEFNETWWNSVQEGEPIAQDEIDEVKSLIASFKLAVSAMEHVSNAYERELLDYPDTLEECVNVVDTALSEINRISGGSET